MESSIIIHKKLSEKFYINIRRAKRDNILKEKRKINCEIPAENEAVIYIKNYIKSIKK